MSNTETLDLDGIEVAAKRAQTMNVPLTVTAEQALALVAKMRAERSRSEALAHSWKVSAEYHDAAEAKLMKIRRGLYRRPGRNFDWVRTILDEKPQP